MIQLIPVIIIKIPSIYIYIYISIYHINLQSNFHGFYGSINPYSIYIPTTIGPPVITRQKPGSAELRPGTESTHPPSTAGTGVLSWSTTAGEFGHRDVTQKCCGFGELLIGFGLAFDGFLMVFVGWFLLTSFFIGRNCEL